MNIRQKRNFFRSSRKSDKDGNAKDRRRRRPAKGNRPSFQRTEYKEGALPDLIKPQKHITVKSDYSDEVIGDVFTAVYDATAQKTVSFDEAVELIKQREEIADDEEILYVGKGVFAITAYEGEKRARSQVIRRKIDFEQNSEALVWRDSLRFDISLGRNPAPAPTDSHELDGTTAQDSTAQDSQRDTTADGTTAEGHTAQDSTAQDSQRDTTAEGHTAQADSNSQNSP